MTGAYVAALRERVAFLKSACGYSSDAVLAELLAEEVRRSYRAAGIRLSAKKARRETARLLKVYPLPRRAE